MREGIYILEGRAFIMEGEKYLIAERKKDDSRKPKPKHYLIVVEPKVKKHYVSSLFPVPSVPGEELYHFDFQQELFQLKVSDSIVELSKA